MHSAKEKLSNIASAAKEKISVGQAKTEEKAEEAAAGTEEEKKIAHERRKAKEAEAKMELHEAKASHASEKLQGKESHGLYGYHQPSPAVPTGTHIGRHGHQQPLAGTTTTPVYPSGRNPNPPTHKYL